MNETLIALHNAMIALKLSEGYIIAVPLLVLCVMAYGSYKEDQGQKRTHSDATEHVHRKI